MINPIEMKKALILPTNLSWISSPAFSHLTSKTLGILTVLIGKSNAIFETPASLSSFLDPKNSFFQGESRK